MKKQWTILFLVVLAFIGLVFLLARGNKFDVDIPIAETELLSVPEAEAPEEEIVLSNTVDDIEPQTPLENPPDVIKAIYATSWSASSVSKMDYLINLIKKTELNAIVIDIKDFSGLVLYDIDNEKVKEYNAKEVRISRLNALIKRLHDEGIYVIARQTVFQDPTLAAARPDLAVRNSLTGNVWEDRKGISWVDPASQEVWDYNIEIALDAALRGFDEINFDYIRFPSDGNLSVIDYPFFNASTTLKTAAIGNFFEYLDDNLGDVKISADLFGLSTINYDGLGIGQLIEDAYKTFDYVAPMVYPSHYAVGFQGYANPALFPYEVIKFSMDAAVNRLAVLVTTSTPASSLAELRPWLQDFDLGANYTAEMIRLEKQATYDAGVQGWMLWDPRNNYTEGALDSE